MSGCHQAQRERERERERERKKERKKQRKTERHRNRDVRDPWWQLSYSNLAAVGVWEFGQPMAGHALRL